MEKTLQLVAAFIGIYVMVYGFYSYVSLEAYLGANGLDVPSTVICKEDLWFFDVKGNILVSVISSAGLFLCIGLHLMHYKSEPNYVQFSNLFISKRTKRLWKRKKEPRHWLRIISLTLVGIIIILMLAYVVYSLWDAPLMINIYIFINILIPLVTYGFIANKKMLFTTYWLLSFVIGYFIIFNLQKDHKAKQNYNLSFLYKGEKRGKETVENLIFWGREKIVMKDTLGQIRLYPTDQVSDVLFRTK